MAELFVAIDTPDLNAATDLARSLTGAIDGVKLGLEFFLAHGTAGYRSVAETGLPVFLDLKLHDIPNTVAGAVRSLAPLGPSILTIHAAGGHAMIAAAREAAPAATRVVAVTVLTSLDADDLAAAGVAGDPAEQVARLAELTRSAGADGIVCSGAEVGAAHRAWRDGVFVVPGIRPAGGELGDQKRVVTPREAVELGASVLVVGRPITRAADPRAAALAIRETL